MSLSINSLAYSTDLSILGFEGNVVDRGSYILAETPDNPGYYWGNLLLMKAPPKSGDFEKWVELFRHEFKNRPKVKHLTFGWDNSTGEAAATKPFTDAGFKLEFSVILTVSQSQIKKPPRYNAHCEIRSLETDQDWEDAIMNQVATREEGFKEAPYLEFKKKQMGKYRRMTQAGLGKWFAAFVDGKLAADCGVYVFGEVGRFQSVGTHPKFRRQGLCGSLVFAAANWAFANTAAKKLVMVADPEYHAAKIYESVGFRPTEKQAGCSKWPEDEQK